MKKPKYGRSVMESLVDFQQAVNKLRNMQVDNMNFTAILHPMVVKDLEKYYKCICGHQLDKHYFRGKEKTFFRKKNHCEWGCSCPKFTTDNLEYLEAKYEQKTSKA